MTTNIITSQHTNHLPRPVQLHEESLVEVLLFVVSIFINRTQTPRCSRRRKEEGWSCYLLQLRLSLRHRGKLRMLWRGVGMCARLVEDLGEDARV